MFGGFVSLKREKHFLIQLLTEKKSDTIFLQETCGTPGVENNGIIMCSLVTSQNIVGAKWILVKDKSDYEVKECQKDGQGRFVLLKVLNQCSFWRIQRQLDELELEENCQVITGGDFHVILDADLDGSGRKPQVKEILWKNRGLVFNFISTWLLFGG